MAVGSAPLLLVDQVCEQLTGLLALSACRFQDGAAGLGGPPRLRRDGQVLAGGRIWDAGHDGLPPGTSTELLAEASGLLQGRFLLTPGPPAPLTLEQRLVAVALADQAGAALAGTRLAARPGQPRRSEWHHFAHRAPAVTQQAFAAARCASARCCRSG